MFAVIWHAWLEMLEVFYVLLKIGLKIFATSISITSLSFFCVSGFL